MGGRYECIPAMLRKPGGKLRIKGRKYNFCNLWDFWPITSPLMGDLRVKKNNLGSKWPVLKLGKLWPELVQCGQNWKVGPTFEFNRIPSSWREGHQYENVCKIYFGTEDNRGKRIIVEKGRKQFLGKITSPRTVSINELFLNLWLMNFCFPWWFKLTSYINQKI